MPQFNTLTNSNFDRERFLKLFQTNDGTSITTKDIMQGWESVKDLINEEFVRIAKESPVFVSSKGNEA
ncbi:MAG: hypothetical protein H7839_02540 [Magnetococcus sp. YQC-5]